MSMIPSNLSKEVEKLLNRIKPGEKVKISIIPGEDQKGKEEVIPVMEQNELIPFEPNTPAMYKPAIYFVDNVVYTPNGSITHPATIYNTMMGINDHMVDDLVHRTTEVTREFDTLTADNIVENIAKIVMDPFVNELKNIYSIFIDNINSKWYNKKFNDDKNLDGLNENEYYEKIDNDATYGIPYFHAGDRCIDMRAEQLKDVVIYMVNPGTPIETTEAIMANTFSLYSISFINLIGMDIYNNIRTTIAQCFSNNKSLKAQNTEETIGLFIQDIDSEFANMMANFTQASLAFCQNLDNIIGAHYGNIEDTGRF